MASVTSLGVHEPSSLRYAVLENILPPDPPKELYDWDVFSDENGDDELLTTSTCVIWSRGGEVGRCLHFDVEQEPILKALLAYFPTSEENMEEVEMAVRGGNPQVSVGACVGHAQEPPRDARRAKLQNSTAYCPALAKALVVLLKTQAHVYSFSGGDHVVHMPFEVETAIAAPVGVIIQRKSKVDVTIPVTFRFPRIQKSSFVSSQTLPLPTQTTSSQSFSTASLGKPKPLPSRLGSTLEAMWDTPLEIETESGWPRLVCLTDPLLELGFVVAQAGRSGKERNPRIEGRASPFLDPAEEILHVESIPQDNATKAHLDDLTLAVTMNRDSSMYTIWQVTYTTDGNRFVRRPPRAKTKAAVRRHSSKQPGMPSGAETPHRGSLRESTGVPLPVKKTRSERLEKDKDQNKDRADGALEKALSLEPDRAEASRRQSRRVSSLLARADLSASHDRPLFAEQPSTLGNSISGPRAESYSQRGRTGSAQSVKSGSANYDQTLNSLLDAPVNDILEDPRSGGELEGINSMDLEDTEINGFSREIVFSKIHSLAMDAANIRYSLSSTPATKLCKVFVVAGTPYSVDEPDRNYLLVCIQDTIDKRLQLLTLHIQKQRRPNHFGDGTVSISITWGQHRKAQHVVDSCRIYDGGQSMILILSEGDNGQRQLSIQAPWSELTTLSLPPLLLHDRNKCMIGENELLSETPDPSKTTNARICKLKWPRGNGVIDVVGEDGKLHQVRIQLEPKSARVRQVLTVIQSILTAGNSEKIVMGWWRIMQWLGFQPETNRALLEWTALTTELCVLFLSLVSSDATQFDTATLSEVPEEPRTETIEAQFQGASRPWATSKAWSWVVDDKKTNNISPMSTSRELPNFSSPLHKAIWLARRFMASPAGAQAVGIAGYLPTAAGLSNVARKSAAWGIIMALHLFLEEEKLDTMASASNAATTSELKALVHQMAEWLQWKSFAKHYASSLSHSPSCSHNADIQSRICEIPEPASVPSIFNWVSRRLVGRTSDAFPSLGDLYSVMSQQNGKHSTVDEHRWQHITPRTTMLRLFFSTTSPSSSSACVVESMFKCGFTSGILDSLPEGLSTPFHDAISRCQQHPPAHWTNELYELIGRGDINTVLKPDGQSLRGANRLLAPPNGNIHHMEGDDEFHMQVSQEPGSEERQIVIQALFNEDKRLYEAQSMLSSSKPRVIRLNPQPSWSEPEYLERQKELVTTIATSTLATSAGRGMLNFGFRFPLLTQKFNVQGFNLTCIVKPSNVAVGVDKNLFTEDKVNWAFFHQGVAYGLAISAQAKGIDTSWIVFNKPSTELSHRHAGFLLALGLNGHLKSVAKWVAFKYLTPKHMMTSIGLLLGLAVSHLGTMDSLITRLLSVHVTRMLPRGAAELNLSHQIQTTGILGIGLLYYNTQHRRMSEIMMSEINYFNDEDEEDPLRNEGYRLAAAYSLGFINLGKGSERKGLMDMQITEQLLSLAASPKNVELVNVLDRSAAAATIAIALVYMKTEDHVVARKIDIPDSILQFDYVRPDVLLLRTLAKNLIMWNEIEATTEWLQQSLPSEYRSQYKLKDITALRSVDLPLFSIIAGHCFAAALRFAGTGNQRVRDMLVHYLDLFIHIVQDLPVVNFDSQIAQRNARMCMDILALSCATVMAGTGDLVVFRRLRALHGRDDAHTNYGSHFAAHLAIGALFLGSGTTTFGNNNLAIAALLVAFYPVFPMAIQDNGSHLQAFRHFWVLATEARCLVTKDVSSGQPISVPILIHLKPSALSLSSPSYLSTEASVPYAILRRETPVLLPPLDDIVTIHTDASSHGFWDLEIPFGRDPSLRAAFHANQNLYLRRRPTQQSAFAMTLQALGNNKRSRAFAARANSQTGDPLEWLFGCNTFRDVSRAEREHILGIAGMYEDDGGNSCGRAPSNAIDARLVLESTLNGNGSPTELFDSLSDLRLLSSWIEQRGQLQQDRVEVVDKKESSMDTKTEERRGGDGMPLRPMDAEVTEMDKWWMGNSSVDMLKGKVWILGQEN